MKRFILAITFLTATLHLGMAQCYPDRHNTTWYDGWLSCEPSENPNSARGVGHWILYDFKEVYKLGQMHLWNSNEPGALGNGVREIVVDYSDGLAWIELGRYTFEPGTGLNNYEGEVGPHLGDTETQFLLITILDNHGGECYGFSELQIEAEEITTSLEDPHKEDCAHLDAFPNPFNNSLNITYSESCGALSEVTLVDMLGKQIWKQNIDDANPDRRLHINTRDLTPGSYVLHAIINGRSVQQKVIKAGGK